MKRTQLEKYEQEAEKSFSNYYGEDFDDIAGYDEFYDDDEDYDDEDYDDEDYDDEDHDDEDEGYFENFTGAGTTGKSGKRHLTFRIKNSNTDVSGNPAPADVTLFGAYGSYTANAKVPITLDEGDYAAFLSEIAANPHTLVNPRYRVKNASQYANSFEIKKIEASGQTSSTRVQPQNYEDPKNNIQNLVLMNDFGLVADGRTSLGFRMEAGEEISIAFEIAARVNNSLLLTGGSSSSKRKNKASGGRGKKASGCNCNKKASGGRGGRANTGRGGNRRRRND